MSFLAGLLWIGAVLVLVFGFAVGYAARGDDNRRYYANQNEYLPELEPARPVVHAVAERPAPPVVVNLVLPPGFPQPSGLWPGVVEGQVLRELPR